GGGTHEAVVVAYDPARDLAVIHVPGLAAPVMPFSEGAVESGADAIVLGFPLDAPQMVAEGARVREVRDISGPDIYDSTEVTREVYSIRALGQSGNSGGPLIAPTGEVLGVISAAAADDPHIGFAVTAAEAAPVAAAGIDRTTRADTGDCT